MTVGIRVWIEHEETATARVREEFSKGIGRVNEFDVFALQECLPRQKNLWACTGSGSFPSV